MQRHRGTIAGEGHRGEGSQSKACPTDRAACSGNYAQAHDSRRRRVSVLGSEHLEFSSRRDQDRSEQPSVTAPSMRSSTAAEARLSQTGDCLAAYSGITGKLKADIAVARRGLATQPATLACVPRIAGSS